MELIIAILIPLKRNTITGQPVVARHLTRQRSGAGNEQRTHPETSAQRGDHGTQICSKSRRGELGPSEEQWQQTRDNSSGAKCFCSAQWLLRVLPSAKPSTLHLVCKCEPRNNAMARGRYCCTCKNCRHTFLALLALELPRFVSGAMSIQYEQNVSGSLIVSLHSNSNKVKDF